MADNADNEAREWLVRLPAELAVQRRIMTRLLDLCVAEPAARDQAGQEH